jgi:uncharacterized protein (TIGR02588 family)
MWLGRQSQPPVLSVVAGKKIRQSKGQFYVPFTLTNEGGETAESVRVNAELEIDNTVEEGEQEIDFLSSKEVQEGAFIFKGDPKKGKLSLRVSSYKLP